MASKEIRGFFLTTKDEADFSTRLRSAIPRAMFLDDDRSGEPKEIAFLSDATSIQAWILKRPNEAPLRWDRLPPLIQFLRSRLFERYGLEGLAPQGLEGVLRVGSMAIAYEGDADTRAFVDAVWKVFRKMCTNRLVTCDPVSHTKGKPVRDVWIGRDAERFHESGGVLASNAASLYYTRA